MQKCGGPSHRLKQRAKQTRFACHLFVKIHQRPHRLNKHHYTLSQNFNGGAK
jgi:hypothetical protein